MKCPMFMQYYKEIGNGVGKTKRGRKGGHFGKGKAKGLKQR
ncbi:MAG TPA: hypothetical protein VJI13_00735 [Candidatus Norongarragalinales archaeon]|nr:hypothetical protein [Candidatus Norongarragalinales archaeon]